MDKIKEQQLEALDVLGKQAADIERGLNDLAKLTNPFDIEAKLYFIASLGKRIETAATRLHAKMHTENSVDHPHLCAQHFELPENRSFFESIFGKGFSL